MNYTPGKAPARKAGALAYALFLFTAAPISTSCTTSGMIGEFQDTVADVVLPPEQAAELGKRMSEKFESETKLHPSEELQQYVSELGHQVVAQLGETPEAFDFHFKVVDAPDTVNAFAMPGGYIYIYSGLIKKAETEAQLVSVLAHEVAHITQRHVAERLSASYGLQLLASAAFGENPSTVGQLVANIAQQGFLLKYSRDQESQADRVGLDYMIDAGYDPHGAVEMFGKLSEAGGAQPPVFLSSHPAPRERMRELRQIIDRKQEKKDLPDHTGRERFQRMQRLI